MLKKKKRKLGKNLRKHTSRNIKSFTSRKDRIRCSNMVNKILKAWTGKEDISNFEFSSKKPFSDNKRVASSAIRMVHLLIHD